MNRIRELRKARKLSQKDLSELTGFSQVNISRYESGQRSFDLETAAVIAAALRCKVDDLIRKKNV